MRQARVCMVTYDWYTTSGAGDIRARRLAEAAVDGGYRVDVICLRQPHEKRRETCNGVRIYRVPQDRSYESGRSLPRIVLGWTWFLVQAQAVLAWLHLKHRYDVIHVHNMPDFLVFSAWLPKLMGAKVILDVQDASPELMAAKSRGALQRILKLIASWQERASTAFAHHVVTVGWPFEQLLVRRHTPQDKVTIIINSADPKLFPHDRLDAPACAGTADQPKLILMYHGMVAERNGLDTAVRALAQAASEVPGVELHIMGHGEELANIRRLAATLGIVDRVVFFDPCPSEKLVDFVEHGQIGIIPYRRDGFADLVLPTKAYEFAWMRRPIIASDTPAIRSMFREDSIALCEPDAPESFARAIVELYQNPEKRAAMADGAAQDYEPYRWEQARERYWQLLASLAGAKGPRGAATAGSDGRDAVPSARSDAGGRSVGLRRWVTQTKRTIFALVKYMTNHMIGHIPSYLVRHAWYRHVLGWQIGPRASILMGQYIEMGGLRSSRSKVIIGDGSIINRGVLLQTLGGLVIGKNVSVSTGVSLVTGAHDMSDPQFTEVMKPIIIGDYAWIGTNATVLGGVTIGEGAVVCAGAIVRSDVRPYAVVDGVPAKVVGTRRLTNPSYTLNHRPLFE